MKRPAGTGRSGLPVLTAAVLLAHGLLVESVADSVVDSRAASTAAAQPRPPVTSRVRLVEPPPPTPRPTPTTEKVTAAATVTATPAQRPARPGPPPKERSSTPPPAATVPEVVAPEEVAPSPTDGTDATEEPTVPTAQADEAPMAQAPESAGSDPTPTPPASRPPVMLPPDVDLQYQVQGRARGLNYRASGELRWRQTSDTYELSMQLSAFLIGSRSQTSVGRIDATGLLPDRFSDRTRSERAAHFDHAGQRIRYSNNAPDAELLPGAQDRLSVFLQLAGLLQAGSHAAGETIELPVASAGGSERWRFRVGELEPLDLPAGTLQARRLVREPVDPRDSRVELWLAPELGHLPVRLQITQGSGDTADQQLSRRP